MTEKDQSGTARRPYRPPQLEQVQLVVEEAVLRDAESRRCRTTGYRCRRLRTGQVPSMAGPREARICIAVAARIISPHLPERHRRSVWRDSP